MVLLVTFFSLHLGLRLAPEAAVERVVAGQASRGPMCQPGGAWQVVDRVAPWGPVVPQGSVAADSSDSRAPQVALAAPVRPSTQARTWVQAGVVVVAFKPAAAAAADRRARRVAAATGLALAVVAPVAVRVRELA